MDQKKKPLKKIKACKLTYIPTVVRSHITCFYDNFC